MAREKEKTMTYAELAASVQRGVIPPIVVLAGHEDYLIRQMRDRLLEKTLTSGAEMTDKVVYHGDGRPTQIDPESVQTNLLTPPFLSPKKVVHIRQSGLFNRALPKDSGLLSAWQHVLKQTGPHAMLLFEEHRGADEHAIRKDHKLLGDIRRAGGVVLMLDYQDIPVLRRWISAKCKQHDRRITREAADSLISRYGQSMTLIEQALDMIFLYAEYEARPNLTLSDIELICRPDLTGSVFDLTDALAAGEVEQALTYLDRLLERREPPLAILAAVSSLIRRLIIAAELGNATRIIQAGVTKSSFYAKKLVRQSRRFSVEQLEMIAEYCFLADQSIKTSRMEGEEALTILVIRACRLPLKTA